LGFLADFMEIGMCPERYGELKLDKSQDEAQREVIRKEHQTRTNVWRLDYQYNGGIDPKHFGTCDKLRDELKEESEVWDSNVQLRLYVVEDLSQTVIELLGKQYDVDPAFFRGHILDAAWFSVGSPWRDPPSLVKDIRNQPWTQIRYVTARYFKTEDCYNDGENSMKTWNVVRRMDKVSLSPNWDKLGAVVGLIRSKASFWQTARREGITEKRGDNGDAKEEGAVIGKNCFSVDSPIRL